MANPHAQRGQNFTETIHHDTYPFIAEANHTGRTVFITGASKGIGRTTALAFARSGAANIILAARSSLDGVKAEIESLYGHLNPAPNVVTISLDVTSEDAVDAALEVVKKHVSSIDILINNAGCLEEFKPVKETNRREWWQTWEVNIKGAYLVTHAFLDLVLASESKTIINISSKGGLYTRHGASAYGSSKAAIIRFSEFLDFEYRSQGLVAFALHPGSIPTELALGLPASGHAALTDTTQLAADTMAWLTQERRPWLGGRYVSSNWDMSQLLLKKEEIIASDKLKLTVNF
ncbi:hypothetical protein NLG97_g4425 [Lecanicillium saksenae]|uniref:Uncharacterized protein n=1 Tax=Lecanicillium saksenae TaxID=468837 RepID=A0ACC1QXV5_9HYPO|nr:hypothetical protein NLG97_g4425 [Lecanicillium saksenae]